MQYYLKYHGSLANKQNMIMTTYKEVLRFRIKSKKAAYTGWPTKMSLFFFANNFYKNKENFKIFSPQLLKVYRILLMETNLELIVFYYTFSVINTMFAPCTDAAI